MTHRLHIAARAAALGIALAGLGGIAAAHPDLVAANPSPGAAVSARPTELRISFTEPLFVNFSGVVLTDARGKRIGTGKAKLAPGDAKVLVVPLKAPLAPGTYTVQWHAVSADTHRITGSYRFTVR